MNLVPLRYLSKLPIANGLGLSGTNDNPEWPRYIRTTDIAGPTSLRDDVFASQPPEVASAAMVAPGDILMTAAGASIGKSVTFSGPSPACYAGFLVRVRPRSATEGRFLGYWMQSAHYWHQIHSGAVKSTIENFSAGRYRGLLVPQPELSQQRAIVSYLDRETSKVDALIAEQEGLVQVLRERRVAVAARASTLGLHSDEEVVLDDDPVVGLRPKRWAVKSLRHWFTSLDSQRIPLSSAERGTRQGRFPYYGASGIIDHVDAPLFSEPLVLVSEDGANLLARSTPIAFAAKGEYWVNNHAHVLRPRNGSVDYWAARIETVDVAPVVSGSAQPKLTADALLSLRVAAPDDSGEQCQIADYIAEETAKVDTLISEAEGIVAVSKERRAALITAAVTGQIDVRGEVA